MKTPRFLLGAALLFWGWQTDFLVVGAAMAVTIEAARFVKARWEISDDDFSRIWTFCSLLFLAAAVYAFTANEGPANFGSLFASPSLAAQNRAGASGARTAAALIRWTPMVFFWFVAAQAYSSRAEIPLETISLILRRRWIKARKHGRPLPATRGVNVSHPYFALCLLAASIHAGQDNTFFWGLCALLAWALWPQRSRRFSLIVWMIALAAVASAGYFGQRGISQLQHLVEGYNPRWFSVFARRGFDPKQSSTALGQIGRLKASGKIVIRLEPKNGAGPPAYLREASYILYREQRWSTGRSGETFTDVPHETNETTWLLLPGKTHTTAVNIACYLPGGAALLPLPTASGTLKNLPAYTLQKNSEGAVFAQGPGLVIFDALYGAGATIDSAPDTNDFRVPPKEQPALDRVISEMHVTGLGTNQRLRAVSRFFQSEFTYRTWQRAGTATGTNETPLSRFLLNSRSGHCEYFATATVLLLRQLNIPARYAVGYVVHESSGRGYVVRQRDAHAWCLVWNPEQRRWQDFDTTPASWVEAEGKLASSLQWLSDFWSKLGFEFAKFRWGQTHLRQYLLWALTPALLLLLYQILFRRKWQRQRRKPERAGFGASWPGLDSEFYQVERKLAERGTARPPSEPLSEWLHHVAADPALAPVRRPLLEVVRLHYRYRFDPQGLSQSDREALRREVETCLGGLAPSRLP